MSGIVLSASVRQNLLSLQSTASLLATTQNDLATGNKVNSALDNPTNYFTAQSLNNRASDIKRAMDKATINTRATYGSVTGNGAPRGTLLFDAVYAAANEKLTQEAGRKVLILLTDGGDQGSQETLKTATEAAQKANAIIYVILIADRGGYNNGTIYLGDIGARDMDRLASDTGGRVINVGNNGRKLEDAFQQIQDELRTQYLASYTPTDPKADGTYRKLDLTCGKNLKVQTRKGYYAISSIDTQ